MARSRAGNEKQPAPEGSERRALPAVQTADRDAAPARESASEVRDGSADADLEAEPPKTDPEPVAKAELERPEPSDSAPPSIPSAAAAAPPPAEKVLSGSPVLPGHFIADRYEVLSVLGEGGMGIVYRCRDQPTGQQVAIKRVIPPPGNLANEYVAWFYKEARALAALDHPNIVRALDFGQLRDGSPFFAMQLVSGTSLHDLTHARLGFPLIWTIADQILGALAHAHARGVIHGDLKPSNVLVERREHEPPDIHVLDFGLAWLRLDAHDERLSGTKA
ncbi:MAG TPA: serine/threonine-protein kinase, partial [Polyangiaceae bacterium]